MIIKKKKNNKKTVVVNRQRQKKSADGSFLDKKSASLIWLMASAALHHVLRGCALLLSEYETTGVMDLGWDKMVSQWMEWELPESSTNRDDMSV